MGFFLGLRGKYGELSLIFPIVGNWGYFSSIIDIDINMIATGLYICKITDKIARREKKLLAG
jgi:hypothetical protein